jgi:hypothetical protein
MSIMIGKPIPYHNILNKLSELCLSTDVGELASQGQNKKLEVSDGR